MGKHKFRLSDMIPNAWFYKLRDMRTRGGAGAGGIGSCPGNVSSAGVTQASVARPRTSRAGHGHHPGTPRHGSLLPHRASYYYTPRAGECTASPLHPKASDTHLPTLSPPRKSKRRHRRRPVKPLPSTNSLVSSPVSPGCRCGRKSGHGAVAELAAEAPDTPPCRRDMYIGYDYEDEVRKPMVAVAADDELDGKVITSATDIIIDLRSKKRADKVRVKTSGAGTGAKLVLPPIVTKPARREADGCELEDKHIDLIHLSQRSSCKEADTSPVSEQSKGKPRRSVSMARRLKTRANSPRMATKKPKAAAQPARTPPLAESFAVVKSSADPRRDFRESMEEMIVENGIRTAADLEDLLACFLSLNAPEYHDLIVEVFEQIWISLTHIKL